MVKWADETKQRVESMSKEGKSVREISKETSISKSAIHSFLTKLKGVPVTSNSGTDILENNNLELEQNTDMPQVPSVGSIDELSATHFMGEILSKQDNVERPYKPTKETVKADNFLNSLISVEPEGEDEEPQRKIRLPKAPKTPKPQTTGGFRQREIVQVDHAFKGELIAKITMNVNNFEPLLKDFVKPTKEAFLTSLYKKSQSELESLLKTLETTRSVSNMSNQFMHFFWLGSNIVEVGTTQYMGIDTTGLSMALRQQQDEISMIMKEICLDKVDTFKKVQKPEYRLAMILTTTALGVSTQNQIKKLQNKPAEGSRGDVTFGKPQIEAKRTDTTISNAKAQKVPATSPVSLVQTIPESGKKDELKTPVMHKLIIPQEDKVKFVDL
jgi:hypothetical protein